MGFEQAEGAVCQKCGGTVGIRQDGTPYPFCPTCRPKKKIYGDRSASKNGEYGTNAQKFNEAMGDPKEDYWKGKGERDVANDAHDLLGKCIMYELGYQEKFTQTRAVSRTEIAKGALFWEEFIKTHQMPKEIK